MQTSIILFDLDGTISDPSIGIVNCVNYALLKSGYSEQSVAAISAEIGPPLDLMFKKFIPDISDEHITELVMAYRERFASEGYAENTLYEGIPAALHTLTERGYRLAVCTSKPEPAARKVLSHFNLLHYFEFVSGGDVGVKKGAQIKARLEQGHIDTNAIMIGDRAVDLIAANSNGLRSVGVLWGFGDRPELVSQNPQNILTTVPELLTLFAGVHT